MSNYNNGKNEEFFTFIYEEYFDHVHETIKYVINDACGFTEDVAQETMIRLLKYIDTLQTLEKNALKQYIKKSAVNTAINHKKKQSEHIYAHCVYNTEQDIFSFESYNAQKTADDIIEDKITIQLLLKHIKNLSERDQMLISLRYFNDLSDREISEHTGINKDHVRVYISRAVAKLSKSINVY